jgi:N,N'-diacetylchitobiose transport system substrate-binding protein
MRHGMRQGRETHWGRVPLCLDRVRRSRKPGARSSILGVCALLGILVGASACVTTKTESAADRKTIRVWLMEDSAPDKVIADLDKEFEAAHPGYKVRYEIQKWAGIQTTLSAALSSGNPPDVIETGSTQTVSFARGDALLDLTARKADLGGEHWLPGLVDSGIWQGRQYGIPFFASNRIVVYRKDMFERAGVSPPKTQAEWVTVSQRLMEAYAGHPNFQSLLLPGTYWYALSGFIWDRGGQLATQEGGTWKGALDSPQSIEAMRYFRALFKFSKLAPDSDEDVPRSSDVFAMGDTAQMVSLPLYYHEAITKNPSLDGKLGVFPIPGLTPDRPGAVFVGGSNLSIPVRSKHADLAYEYIKLLSGDRYQTRLVQYPNNWYVPDKTTLASAVANDPVMTVVSQAAVFGRSMPVDPRWAAVENEPNVIRRYMTQVLSGGDLATLARQASDEITRRMNAAGSVNG